VSNFFGTMSPLGTQFLVFVLVSLLLSCWGWASWFFGKDRNPRSKQHSQAKRLAVLDKVQIDEQRYAILIQRDNVEHLVLVDGSRYTLIESKVNGAALVREASVSERPVAPRVARPSATARLPRQLKPAVASGSQGLSPREEQAQSSKGTLPLLPSGALVEVLAILDPQPHSVETPRPPTLVAGRTVASPRPSPQSVPPRGPVGARDVGFADLGHNVRGRTVELHEGEERPKGEAHLDVKPVEEEAQSIPGSSTDSQLGPIADQRPSEQEVEATQGPAKDSQSDSLKSALRPSTTQAVSVQPAAGSTNLRPAAAALGAKSTAPVKPMPTKSIYDSLERELVGLRAVDDDQSADLATRGSDPVSPGRR
jgi:hypothetical protein